MSSKVSVDRGAARAVSRQAVSVAPWLPVTAALLYPWTLTGFHGAAVSGGGVTLVAGLWLAAVFALPLSCLVLMSSRMGAVATGARRLALLGLAAPSLFVLTGVLAGLLHSPVKDVWIWSVFWVALGGAAMLDRTVPDGHGERPSPRLRVAHGVAAMLILLFVAFHLFNHLMGLFGPDAHGRVMTLGRLVYRSRVIEPVLVALLLFQVAGGATLAWRWSARPLDLVKAIQVGSGAYLAVFILTHMNSALVVARMVRGAQTDWVWATGAPEGLLLDAWNIRLVPHYALGVLFVVAHLFCGLRQVLVAHGVRRTIADGLWGAGVAGAAVLSLGITAGLCGARL